MDGKTQAYNVPTPRTVYTNAGAAALFAKPGDVVTPSVSYTGTWMHSYVYLDKNQDGQFDPQTELVSYSYYQGKNSEGQAVSNGNTIQPRPFTIPADLAPGIYRLRYKVDWDNNDPLGSGDVLKHGGAFVDIRLNVHGSTAILRQQNLNGEIITPEGAKLESYQAPFGQPFTVKMNPADGFEYAGMIVKHGYHLTADSLSVSTAGASGIRGWVNVAKSLEIISSGASSIRLSGQADYLSVSLSGACDFRAEQLHTRAVEALLAGASRLDLGNVDTISYGVSGASNLRYQGQPVVIGQVVTGASTVNSSPAK